MRLKLAAVLATCLVLEVQAPSLVNACGVKLTVKASAPRKAVARTQNPSQVLLVGSPPRRLANDLTVAGHKVEVVDDASAAKRGDYSVVIVDNEKQASAAREKFGKDHVFVRSGNVHDDVVSVETRVARELVAANTRKAPEKAKEVRPIVNAGPAINDTGPVASKQPEVVAVADPTPPTPTPPVPTPPAPTPKITTTATPKTETPKEPKPAATKPVASTKAELKEEVYFTLGSKEVSSTRPLDRAVAWLNANPSVNFVVEGHADPSGSHEGNMTLSEARAEAVKSYLVTKGIDGGRIEVKPLGDTQLKYGATDGRNRRAAVLANR